MNEKRAAMSVVTSIHDAIEAHCCDVMEADIDIPYDIAEVTFDAIDAAGWAVVPKKPTEEMSRIGAELVREFEAGFDSAEEYAGKAYKAALAAAPRPE